MSSIPRVSPEPGGTADFRYDTWQRLDYLQPLHRLDRDNRCLQEQFTRQLQNSYLHELQIHQFCPYPQVSCQGTYCHPSCAQQQYPTPFHHEPATSYDRAYNTKYNIIEHRPHLNPHQQTYSQYNYNRQLQPAQNQAEQPFHQYHRQNRENHARINRQLQQLRTRELRLNPNGNQVRVMDFPSPSNKNSVNIRGMNYCISQHHPNPHDTTNYPPQQQQPVCPMCESEMLQSNCPPRPNRDLMEPRHYLLTSDSWKGVPLPFHDPRYELLIPGDRDPLSLLPSPNPFVYIGRKTNWTEPRLENPPSTALPVAAKRPEVFGDGSGVALTTNRLGYRAQRRHYREPISMIVYN